MLECKDITVNYQGKTVLDHCNPSKKVKLLELWEKVGVASPPWHVLS